MPLHVRYSPTRARSPFGVRSKRDIGFFMRALHEMVLGSSTMRKVSHQISDRTSVLIKQLADTLRLLHAGAGPGGGPVTGAVNRPNFVHRVKPAVYTYVISVDDDTFRFSETGAKFFVDFASKHALHSNCAEAVRYVTLSGQYDTAY
jgi:hypothetical protein